MIKAGERAPEFTLPDETAIGSVLDRTFELGRHSPVFLPCRFHPRLHPPGLQMLRDLHKRNRGAPACASWASARRVLRAHAKFKAKYQLPFVLLSDEQKTVIKMYGVNGPLGHRRAPLRT
jgi:peroxiredoxin Q/BCP